MSNQLTFSAATAIMVMSLFALTTGTSGSTPEQVRAPGLVASFTASIR